MREIQLTQGKVALVDDQDFDSLCQFSWSAYTNPRKSNAAWYAVRCPPKYEAGESSGVFTKIPMHRQIADALPHEKIDHRDRDGLNNQRYNLRRCTKSQNAINSGIWTTNTSGFKGVSFFPGRTKCWRAYIVVNYKQISLGYFQEKEDAAKAYAEAAVEYFREFCPPEVA